MEPNSSVSSSPIFILNIIIIVITPCHIGHHQVSYIEYSTTGPVICRFPIMMLVSSSWWCFLWCWWSYDDDVDNQSLGWWWWWSSWMMTVNVDAQLDILYLEPLIRSEWLWFVPFCLFSTGLNWTMTFKLLFKFEPTGFRRPIGYSRQKPSWIIAIIWQIEPMI